MGGQKIQTSTAYVTCAYRGGRAGSSVCFTRRVNCFYSRNRPAAQSACGATGSTNFSGVGAGPAAAPSLQPLLQPPLHPPQVPQVLHVPQLPHELHEPHEPHELHPPQSIAGP